MIEEWGYCGGADAPPPGAVPARVTGAWGDYYRVVCDEGECVARKKASAFRSGETRPATGDFVALEWNPRGEGRILSVMPRKSALVRAAAGSGGRRPQTVAVNFDTLFFLTSLNGNFSVRRLERFVALGRGCGAPFAVLLTKSDLVSAAEARARRAEAAAHSGGAEVFAVSSATGEGLDAMARFARPRRTLAFVGSSGVGKSSLVNALAGEEIMPTAEIREWDSKGRHATTERELVRLPCGAMVLDTPGMREIGMWEAGEGVRDAFADVAELAAGCRFGDCRHDTEPGCAVKAAVAAGTLSADRLAAWRLLKAESAREAPARTVSATHRYRK